jgi:hypothetical protein
VKLFDERGLFFARHATQGGKWWRLKYRFDGKEKGVIARARTPTHLLPLLATSEDDARKLVAQALIRARTVKQLRSRDPTRTALRPWRASGTQSRLRVGPKVTRTGFCGG